MDLSSIWYVPLAVVSGAGFALLALVYRIAQPRGVKADHVILIVSILGWAFFATLCARLPAQQVPPWVLLLAGGMAVSQYFMILLVPFALSMGPVSALACVLSMAFLPVTVYAHFAFGDSITVLQFAAFPLAAASIVAASFVQREKAALAGRQPVRPSASFRYGLILLTMFLVNSAPFVALKELGARPSALGGSCMERFGDVYFMMFYAVLGCSVGLHIFIRRSFPPSTKAWIGLGVLGGVGSVVGIACLKLAVAGPTATIFMLNNVTTVVVTAIVAAIFFGEGRTIAWYVTVGCGMAAVVLAKLDEILK